MARRLYYILLLMLVFFIAPCSNESVHAASKSENIDLAIEKLVEAIKSEQVDSKRQDIAEQIEMICKYGSASHIGTDGIDAIASLLEKDNNIVKMAAARALGFIGPPAKYTVPLLQKMQKAMERKEQENQEYNSFDLRTGWDAADEISYIITKINR